jgi:hypothetical protein
MPAPRVNALKAVPLQTESYTYQTEQHVPEFGSYSETQDTAAGFVHRGEPDTMYNAGSESDSTDLRTTALV